MRSCTGLAGPGLLAASTSTGRIAATCCTGVRHAAAVAWAEDVTCRLAAGPALPAEDSCPGCCFLAGARPAPVFEAPELRGFVLLLVPAFGRGLVPDAGVLEGAVVLAGDFFAAPLLTLDLRGAAGVALPPLTAGAAAAAWTAAFPAGADFAGLDIGWTDFACVDFGWTDFTEADFACADFAGAGFDFADFGEFDVADLSKVSAGAGSAETADAGRTPRPVAGTYRAGPEGAGARSAARSSSVAERVVSTNAMAAISSGAVSARFSADRFTSR